MITELLPAADTSPVPSRRFTGYNAAMVYSPAHPPVHSPVHSYVHPASLAGVLHGGLAVLVSGLAGATLLFLGYSVSASAQQEDGWITSEFARSRLVADYVNLPPEGPVTVYLAWEVIMPPGWKTYWRSPGEAGKPPVFSWKGSVNLASAEPLFPLPERFELFDVQNLGYAERLLLPIRISAAIPGAPISVRLAVDFLICKDICVPMQAQYALDLPVAAAAEIKSASADDIQAALERVPRSPEKSKNGLAVLDARVFGPAGKQRLSVDVAGPVLMSAADVFVEAGPGVLFGAPRRAIVGDGTRARLTFSAGDYSGDLDLGGRSLTLTLTDGMGQAIETKFTLDAK